MSVKTKIFAYKGAIGAENDLDNGKFINDPKDGNQLGVVIDTTECEITKEAKDILRTASREGGSFAGIMLTKHTDLTSSVGLIGFWKHMFIGEGIKIGRDDDVSVLDHMTETEMEIPEGFKEAVDNAE